MSASELPRASAYSEGDWDRAIDVSLRSDPVFVVSRLLTLAVMFWLMARAINQHQVSAALLLIPFTANWLAMLWMGLVLSGWVVRCPAFHHDYFRPVKVIAMTALLAGLLLTLMRFDSSVGAVNDGSLGQMVAANLTALKQSGLWIVVLIEILGVALWVWPDILRWQKNGGKFIWQASIQRGVSAAAMFFLAVAAVFTVPWFVDGVQWSNLSAPNVAWLVWGLLLTVELVTLFLGVWLHKDLTERTIGPG